MILLATTSMMANYCSTTTGKFVDPTEFGAAKKIRIDSQKIQKQIALKTTVNLLRSSYYFISVQHSNTSSLSIIRLQ